MAEAPDFIIQISLCLLLTASVLPANPPVDTDTHPHGQHMETGDGTLRGLDLCSESYLTEPFSVDILRLRIEESLKRNAAVA
jgi:hypothetical protein